MAPRTGRGIAEVVAVPAVGSREWISVGGALAVSLLLHGLVLGAIAALLAQPAAPAGVRSPPAVLSAVLTKAAVAATTPSRPDPRPSAVERPRPAPPAPLTPPLPAESVAPWSATAIDTSLPVSMTGPARVAEGVEIVETRSVATLGEKIERRIQLGFADEADLPLQLRPVSAIGYPLDALDAGIEGRVLVWFGVDEEGKVVEREALDGPQELRDWVLDRLDLLVDKPARTLQDRGVRSWTALEVFFNREGAEEARARLAAESAELPEKAK